MEALTKSEKSTAVRSRISYKDWLDSQENELEYWKGIVQVDGEPGRCEYYLSEFARYFDHPEKSIVLDVGAGPRGILRLLNPRIGIAVDPLMDSYEKGGYSFQDQQIVPINSKAEKIPLLVNYADYVFSTNVLDHVQDASKVFSEMVRIVKPGGKIFIIVDLRDRDQTDQYHKVCLNESYFERLIQQYGLKVFEKRLVDSVSIQWLKSFIGVFEKRG